MAAGTPEIEAEKQILRRIIAAYDKSITDLTDSLPTNLFNTDGIYFKTVHETIGYLSNQRKQLYDYLNSL